LSLATIGLVTSAVITVGMAATVFSLVVRSDVHALSDSVN
jgi:hypothetical protein